MRAPARKKGTFCFSGERSAVAGKEREFWCATEIAPAAMGQRRQMRKKPFKPSTRRSRCETKTYFAYMPSARMHINIIAANNELMLMRL